MPRRRRSTALALSAGLMMALAMAGGAGVPTAGAGVTSAPAPAASLATGTSNRVVKKVVIGRSVQGRPIWAYRKGNPHAKRVVVILGQMHGDERAGVRAARYTKNHVPVSLDADVWIVPTMNPDGYRADTRRNARGVDLNRNWPTHWVSGDGTGSRALSEPETRAMRDFLRRKQPRFIASMHQPFGVVSRSDKNMTYVHRLSRQLDLPIARVQVGDCQGADCPPSPTLTSWYNTRQDGASVTIELTEHPTRRYLTRQVGPGILRAQRAY